MSLYGSPLNFPFPASPLSSRSSQVYTPGQGQKTEGRKKYQDWKDEVQRQPSLSSSGSLAGVGYYTSMMMSEEGGESTAKLYSADQALVRIILSKYCYRIDLGIWLER